MHSDATLLAQSSWVYWIWGWKIMFWQKENYLIS